MPDESVMVEEDGTEKEEGEKREIGKLAVWTVSSNKPGNGVEMLRDNNLTTYWQSDGAQPHLVNIQFQKKVRLQQVAIYVDFKVDESYTPNKISIRAGNSFHDLREIKVVDLVEPTGWVHVSLCSNDSKDFLRAFLCNWLSYQIIRMEEILIFDKLRFMAHARRLSLDIPSSLRQLSSVHSPLSASLEEDEFKM